MKRTKKHLYLQLFRRSSIGTTVTWQASSELERQDIRRAIDAGSRSEARISIAPNLPRLTAAQPLEHKSHKRSGGARLIFLGRISRMKNLDYALRVLHNVRGNVELDIYGPCEDSSYWNECERIIDWTLAKIIPRESALTRQ